MLRGYIEGHSRFVVLFAAFIMLGGLLMPTAIHPYLMTYMEIAETHSISTHRVYNLAEKANMLAATAIGTIVGIYPLNFLLARYGARWVLFVDGIISAAVSCAVPVCFDYSLGAAQGIRFMMGCLYAADFGAVGLIVSRWAPKSETAIYGAILSSFLVLVNIIEIPAAILVFSLGYGWRTVYYVVGAIVLVCSFIWLLLYRDHPSESYATEAEVALISIDKSMANERQIRPPYRLILTDVAVYGIWAAAFVDVTVSVMMGAYLSTYLDIFGFDKYETGWAFNVACYGIIVFKIIAGLMSDRINIVSERTKIRLFSLVSLLGPAAVLIAMAALPSDASTFWQIVFTVALQWFVGWNAGAFNKGAILISGPYAFFVLGQVQLFKSIGLLMESFLFNWLVPNKTHAEFRVFFLMHAALLVVGFMIYLPMVRAEPSHYVPKSKTTDDEVEDVVDAVTAQK